MQSVIQKKSYGSVKTFWLNKELLEKRIRQVSQKILNKRKEVQDIILFGSFAQDKATVTSDIDILLVVKNSDKRFIDRQLDYRDYFDEVGLNVDVFVYTSEEVDNIPIAKEALSKGISLR